jgi:hypothetical protein
MKSYRTLPMAIVVCTLCLALLATPAYAYVDPQCGGFDFSDHYPSSDRCRRRHDIPEKADWSGLRRAVPAPAGTS